MPNWKRNIPLQIEVKRSRLSIPGKAGSFHFYLQWNISLSIRCFSFNISCTTSKTAFCLIAVMDSSFYLLYHLLRSFCLNRWGVSPMASKCSLATASVARGWPNISSVGDTTSDSGKLSECPWGRLCHSLSDASCFLQESQIFSPGKIEGTFSQILLVTTLSWFFFLMKWLGLLKGSQHRFRHWSWNWAISDWRGLLAER